MGRISDRMDLIRVDESTGCWIWLGKRINNGYGRWIAGTAHRAMYAELVGPIPCGLQIDHLCRVRLCVNPKHLEPVTSRENNRRKFAAFTHCVNGHPYDEANTYVRPNGRRDCRGCNRDRQRRHYALYDSVASRGGAS
jgi:hypothetical protein